MNFLRLLVALTMACSTACFPRNWTGTPRAFENPNDFPFNIGPYLLSAGPGAMAVVVEHPLKRPPVIEWWVSTSSISLEAETPSADAQRVTAQDVEGLWVARLENLPVGQELQYRVRSELGFVGPFRFFAGRERGQTFRFAAFGDTRTGHQVHRALIEAMAKENIDFVIHSGDLVEFGGVDHEWETFFQIEAPVIARRPLFAAIGNHDESPRGNFERYFLNDQLSAGRRYHARDWGDVRVVVMDSEAEARPGSEQYAFVEAALREGAAKNLLMILVLHYPPYSSGEHGSYLEFREVIESLAPRYGVELVLAGHDHDYERTKPIQGVTYIVAASGGATIRRIQPSAFSEVLRTEPHFVLFDVDRQTLVGRAINLANDTFDSFIIRDTPARTKP